MPPNTTSAPVSESRSTKSTITASNGVPVMTTIVLFAVVSALLAYILIV